MDEQKGIGKLGRGTGGESAAQRRLSDFRTQFQMPVRRSGCGGPEKDRIVFVEVKTRRSVAYGLPCEAITESKKRRLRNIADFYMKSRRLGCCAMRIDVVELVYQNGGWYYRHLINAV